MSSGSNKRKRQALLGFRATDEEAAMIRAAAQVGAGCSVADFCRVAALSRAVELVPFSKQRLGLDRP